MIISPSGSKKYRVVSGDNQHKDDRLLNASISFLPVNQNSPHPPKSFILDNTGFVHFQYFNTSGRRSGDSSTRYSIAEGEVPPSFGSVTAVKIVNHIENQNWVIIDEIWLVT
ncbi:hypothetical protein EB796_008271 [Bugula neritina]|uniref:Uncharacterized protein n=1 Tax=Bugula neritina TaxID=10212 RepID=A0A7J7K469_BUGNE|nr:hypothetical protein EB796_008271 [Bugula neritina]